MSTESGVLLMATPTRRNWCFISGTRATTTMMHSDRNVATAKDGLGVLCTSTSPNLFRIEREVRVRYGVTG